MVTTNRIDHCIQLAPTNLFLATHTAAVNPGWSDSGLVVEWWTILLNKCQFYIGSNYSFHFWIQWPM